VEQAEDEIAAVNMALGAWYAGGRALVTTAGGGFALMCEGISLAGMIETPVVVHIGGRPGPATGLPTRTEQADLELALYAGHGEFPRMILAPGTLDEAFQLTRRAFDLADEYQIPVFVLTDQFLLDSYMQTAPFDLSQAGPHRCVSPTDHNYRRYAITPGGVSPRGIPGHGEGLVCVDSDEHTEEGFITESMAVRTAMVDKRLEKLSTMRAAVLPPTRVGPDDAGNVVVCWGSTFGVVEEALRVLGRSDTAMVHFAQVYPLHGQARDMLAAAKRLIMVENNATGQFERVLRLHAGVNFQGRIHKYNGMPFAVEEVAAGLQEALR
jgi:2-oxoglutarate ferredoxin oxidoreductase subunit alpha